MGNALTGCCSGQVATRESMAFTKKHAKEKQLRRKKKGPTNGLKAVLPSNWHLTTHGKSTNAVKSSSVLDQGYCDVHTFYEIGKELGRGMFGVSRIAVDRKTGEELACKTISKRWLRAKDHHESIKREEQILRHLAGHPYIARLIGSYEDEQAVHFVMELCRGGMLYDRVTAKGFYTESEAANMTRQIVEVVEHLHSVGVMHRDLKLENFLLADHREEAPLKTIDFGLSVFFKPGQRFSELVGSAYYVAPEVINKDYGPEADIWSAGVILYMLLCGVPPFYDVSEEGILGAVKRGVFDLEADPWPTISAKAKDLVKGMLKVNPSERLTVKQILNHEWLREGGCAPNEPITCPVLNRVKQFMLMNKLKRLAYNVIVEASLNVEERKVLEERFQMLDVDGDGTISCDEMKGRIKAMNCPLSEIEINAMLHATDIDGNGRIDFTEFAATAMVKRKVVHDEAAMKVAFSFFDIDKTGFITAEMLKDALNDDEMMGCVRDIIQEYDTDKDGRIDFEEFAAMMRQGYTEGGGIVEPDGYDSPPFDILKHYLVKNHKEEDDNDDSVRRKKCDGGDSSSSNSSNSSSGSDGSGGHVSSSTASGSMTSSVSGSISSSSSRDTDARRDIMQQKKLQKPLQI